MYIQLTETQESEGCTPEASIVILVNSCIKSATDTHTAHRIYATISTPSHARTSTCTPTCTSICTSTFTFTPTHAHPHPLYLGFVDIRLNPNATLADVSAVDDSPYDKVQLDFIFAFYGHLHDYVYISPNGFVSFFPVWCRSGFCDYDGRRLYTRYISPMLADFNPQHSENSTVHYLLEGMHVFV